VIRSTRMPKRPTTPLAACCSFSKKSKSRTKGKGFIEVVTESDGSTADLRTALVAQLVIIDEKPPAYVMRSLRKSRPPRGNLIMVKSLRYEPVVCAAGSDHSVGATRKGHDARSPQKEVISKLICTLSRSSVLKCSAVEGKSLSSSPEGTLASGSVGITSSAHEPEPCSRQRMACWFSSTSSATASSDGVSA